MSNFINPSVLAAESLDQLSYDLIAGNIVYKDKTADFSSSAGYAVGDTVTIRTVSDFDVTEFTGVGPVVGQEIRQSKTQLVIEKHFDATVKITAKERALNLDGVREEIINPVMTKMAQEVDEYLLTKITESQGLYASATLLANAADIASARKTANRQQISKVNRIGLVNDDLEAVLLGQDAFSKFDTRGQPGVTALQEAELGRLMGIDWMSSVNMPSVTNVAGNGATTLDSAVATNNLQGQTSLVVDSTTGTFTAGNKIQIAGAKRLYTVATTTAATATAIPIVEEINENLADLDGAAITIVGTGNTIDYQGVVFNPGAFGFAAPPLDAAAGDKTGVATADGISVRVTEWYDGLTKQTYWSFDMLVGAKTIDPRKAMLLGDF